MAIDTGKKLIARRQFVIDAPQQRVWALLPKAIYQCLPLRKIDIVNEKCFLAELKWNLAFVGLKFHLKGEFVDISPPTLLGCVISLKSGIIQLGARVTFVLRPVNQDKSEVVCVALEQGKRGMLTRWAARMPEQTLARSVFHAVRARLEEIC